MKKLLKSIENYDTLHNSKLNYKFILQRVSTLHISIKIDYQFTNYRQNNIFNIEKICLENNQKIKG